MKVLHINAYETPGARFHGLSNAPMLKEYGIDSQHFVWHKDTSNSEVLSFDGSAIKRNLKLYKGIEHLLSLQSVVYPYARDIMHLPEFKQADLIHLHIIHSGFFSMRHLVELTRQKPTVWTLHDPWALTGHCIHPFECERWKIGCGKCPDLKTHFSLKADTSKFLFSYKKRAYEKSNMDIIVASKWMRNMVETSPMFTKAKIHQVPFGIDLDFFSPPNCTSARKRFGIPENAIVISFRAEDSPYKGLPYIIKTLERIDSKIPICLLTVSNASIADQFSNRFQVVELGWVNDHEVVRDVLRACDIYLMPSLAESFGMMAVEAMACGKPVIVFEGTALTDITFAPEVGIAVPKRDANALYESLQRLIDNPLEREERGRKGRAIAEKVYSEKTHVESISKIYKEVAQRKISHA